jgi:hypothetical protein
VHGLTAEFLADNPLFDHVASKGHLMIASNQIFLVVDAGTPVGASRADSISAASARCVYQPAGLYVLEQPRPVYHDHVVGARGMIPAALQKWSQVKWS